MRYVFITIFFFMCVSSVRAEEVRVIPQFLAQGSPFLVQVVSEDVNDSLRSLTLDTTPLHTFMYQGIISALYGIPLTGKTGAREITATFNSGKVLRKKILVQPLIKETRVNPPVPQKLGGNSVQNELRVVSVLEKENIAISDLFTQPKALWSLPFVPPLMNPIVTDIFGYIREGGASTITHKGTDYRAKEGTPVIAMNRGVVRLAKKFTVYGNTIIIDHGLGVQTLYMHLSKIKVAEGQLVEQGTVIGYSGMTGYAQKPHLHLSVRINGASIDPEKFSTLFAKGK